MSKAKPKTTETTQSVSSFVKTIEDKQRQKDSLEIIDIMKKQSAFEPKMWGPSIIGFGSYHYKYESGHEGDAPLSKNHSLHCPNIINQDLRNDEN